MNVIDAWRAALHAEDATPEACRGLAAGMRARKLTFGDRIHCPFLRPFLLSGADESRIRRAAETLASLGERVAGAAVDSKELMAQLGVTEGDERLVRIDPGYATVSTASRLDAFLLPAGLHFAEYNGESPAGPGYTQRLAEFFESLPAMTRFRQGRTVTYQRSIEPLLDALLDSYREWGGRATPPTIAIVDFRGVPTWNEFEILEEAFVRAGVPTLVCDPRDLEFDGARLSAGGRPIDLVYRRLLVNDILQRPVDCDALVRAYEARAVCVANTLRCKLAHKKALFAVLTDPANAGMFTPREHAVIAAHVPWTRVLADTATEKDGDTVPLLELARRERASLVLKPNDEFGGKGVVLGWEADPGAWDDAIEGALKDPSGTWIVQERIPVRRETFPMFDESGAVTDREMLVDLAPFLFRGKMSGYLTRLSATGLANVTSGGGQVPAFVVGP